MSQGNDDQASGERHDLPQIPFGTFSKPLDELLQAMANKIKYEWPTHLAVGREAGHVLEGLVRIARNTYKTVIYLCSDDPGARLGEAEFCLSAPPLARTILDSAVSVIFMFQDLPARSSWFLKSGWKEIHQQHQRLHATYAGRPEYEDWLKSWAAFDDSFRDDARVTPEEAADPARIPYWPNLGQMLRNQDLSIDPFDYLDYLNQWYYRELSSASHLSWPGLANRAWLLLLPLGEDRTRLLDKTRSDQALTTIAMILVLLSELEINLRFGLDEKLKYVWTILTTTFEAMRDLYNARYATRL
jgi:hypothetical protein